LETGPLIASGRTADVFALGDDRVLKLMRPDMPAEIGEWEARAGRVVTAAGLAAPRLLDTCWTDGRFGLVYERVYGPSMLQVVQSRPLQTGRMAAELARLQAEMHATSAGGKGLPSLKETLRGMIERSDCPADVRAAVLDRMETLPDGDAILHYDLHPGNVLMTADGSRVIDWMTVQRGDPAADVARTIFLIRDTGHTPGTSMPGRIALFVVRRWFLWSYLRTYTRLAGLDRAAVKVWRPVMLAGRLAEGIAPERPGLLAEIRRTLVGQRTG
jgi:uncharacterized protein (TIGR02172 family)